MRHPQLTGIALALMSVSLSVATSACTVQDDIEGEEIAGDGDVAADEAYQSDGKNDAAFDAISLELTGKYGLRPRKYNGFFNDSNDAEKRFKIHLPKVVADINARAAAQGLGFRFTAQELAVNFITEGGYYLLDKDWHDSGQQITFEGQMGELVIDGFTFLGCDTIVNNATAVKPWLSADLQTLIADPNYQFETQNELGQTVKSVFVMTLEQGMELNAAMFAWSRQLAAREMSKLGKKMESISAEARFFWTTVWFNAGPGFGQKTLAAHGVDYWKTKWTSGDSPEMSRYARYNALWRTSSWEFMSRTVML
jgi:hypothetical protein